MPNTDPPILTAEDAVQYRSEITSVQRVDFEPLMTIQITDNTTPAMIKEAKKVGVVAGKVYPKNVTTGSQNGVTDFKAVYPVFKEMQEQQMLLLLHGESPDPEVYCLDREKVFLSTLSMIAEDFPWFRIVLEHITTRRAVVAVMALKNVFATITVHHLVLTLDDVVGNLLSPHNFCKPLAKRPQDREALLAAAMSGNPKFSYGGDSAPWLIGKKECSHGCAGIFNAPVALPLLAQIFEGYGKLDLLPNFIGKFGADVYGLPQNTGTIELVEEDWIVPAQYAGIVPFMAGETLHFKLAE